MVKALIDGRAIEESVAGDDIISDDSGSYIMVDEPRLYNVYDGPFDEGLLKLTADQGFSFNAFTFG
ncbi:MAG: hypothetical protein ABIH34_06235 [Nanoarchaeota archaeon]